MKLLRSALLVGLALPLLASCEPVDRRAVEEKREAEYVVPKPDAQYLRKTMAPDYVKPAGAHSECLGRLMFDVPKPVQWPEIPFFGGHWSQQFSENVAGGRIEIGKIEMIVFKKGLGSSINELANTEDTSKNYRIDKLTSRLKNLEGDIQVQREVMKTEPPSERKGSEEWMTARQSEQEEMRSMLAESKEWGPIPNNVPGAVVWWRGDEPRDWLALHEKRLRTLVFSAFIERDGYIYAFRTTQEKDRATLQKEFLDFLSRWRPRADGEIPSDIGLCIPHGFIADDGSTPYEILMHIRHGDALGVLYKITTATVDPRLGPETTAITSAGRALAGTIVGYEKELVDKYVQKKIGPRNVKIGALTAQQGGFAAQKPDKAGRPVNIYSVYTGYGGWQDTHVLPSIIVELESVAREDAPELTQNPPPFEQSMERLDVLLAGMRLRPTQPPMPELRGLTGK